jgi:hypothetical protein
MSMENPGPEQLPPPPDEIHIDQPELKVNAEGKSFETEEGGQFFGGDYLPKPPAEIRIDDELPPPPSEQPHPAI